MLPLSHRIAFAIFALFTVMLGFRGFYRVFLRIRRGRKDAEPRVDNVPARLSYAFRTTLLQTRVFRKRRTLSVFHSFIFYAFVLYLLVNGVDAVDGYVSFAIPSSTPLGAIYGALADSFSVLAIIGVIAFVLRRFLVPARRDFRFNARTLLHPKVRHGFMQRDSIIVSAFILFHVGSRIVGNAARLAMVGRDRAEPFGSLLSPLFVGHHPLAWRIFGYWGALGSVLLFLVYFPYSKHMHLFMAPVKYFFHRNATSGELPQVQLNLDAPEPELGAAQLADLAWPRLLDAYACIQCNRCQDVCPATATGKALSPAALEINKRMVLNGITAERSPFSLTGQSAFEAGTNAGPPLLEVVISPEAAWACTTCGACMEVCPTQDEQMLDIIDIRRSQVMLQGEFPAQLQTAFRGMERNGNPWGLAREQRMAWAEGLRVPTIDEVPEPDVLYWVGCAASYDAGAQRTARAVVQLLTEAKVNFAVLGKRESCTGDSARRAGNELLYQELATDAVQTLKEVRPRQIIASCPHCVNIIGTEYPQIGGNFNIMHHTEYLDGIVREGKIAPAPEDATITFHDPCYLGRHRGTYDQPRSLLKILSNDYVELDRNKSNAFCCGAGGAQFWKEEEPGNERISENRFREVQETLSPANNAKVLAVGCPFCKSMLGSTPSAGEDGSIVVKDVAELLWEGVQRAKGPVPTLPASISFIEPIGIGRAENISAVTKPAKATVMPSLAVTQASDVHGAPPSSAPAKTERKKWSPQSTAAPVLPAAANTSGNSPSGSPQPDTSPERKKWVPKKSPGTAAVEASHVTGEGTSDDAASAMHPMSDASGVPPRKKWQPKIQP